MTHAWHDAYRHSSTPAHHLDPRSKLFTGLAFVGVVLFTRDWAVLQFAGYPALVAAAVLLAGVPLKSVLKRIAAVLPFACLMLLSAIFTRLSHEHLAIVLMKAVLSVAAMAVVSMTTPFPDLLRAFEQLHCPRLLVMFLAFLYRYAAVFGKEVVRLERGWASRSFGRFWWKGWSRVGHVLAALLLRSYERAERVYAAMLARGFSSRMPAMRLLHFGLGDLLFVSASCGLLFIVRWGRF